MGWNGRLIGRAAALLLALAAGASPAAAATWREASSAHFVIWSQESEKALRAYAEKLERFDSALRYLFPVPPEPGGAAPRLTIYSLFYSDQVRRAMHTNQEGIKGVYAAHPAGAIALTSRDGADGVPGFTPQLVLLHEYAHHFMLHNFAGAYPQWFVEGFAEFASTARFDPDGAVGLGIPAQHRAYALFQAPPISLRRILADDVGKLAPTQLEYLYGRGWLMTHYLLIGSQRQAQLGKYLAALNQGSDPAAAAQTAFGDEKALDRELDRYLGKPMMSYYRIPPDQLHIGPIAIREATPAENAIIPVRLESKYGVSRSEALALEPRAIAAAAPFPHDVAAQCMLAEAEHDAGKLDAADAAADRALATDPKAYCALLYKGMVAMGRAAEAKAAAADPRWQQARGWFSRANHASVEEPLPMFLYWQTFPLSKTPPTATAITALMGAAARAPGAPEVRLAAATELLREGKDEEAKAMLGPLANGERRGGAAAFIASIYRRIGKEPSAVLAAALAQGPNDAAKAAGPAL